MPDRAALMAMDAGDLLDFRDAIEKSMAEAVAPYALYPRWIDEAIEARFTTHGQIALEKAGKTHGKVSVDIGDGLKLVANVGQRVEWDQEKLKAAAKDMPWADVQHYFDISFKIGEKTYNAVPPSSPLKPKLDDARTVKLSPMKVSLERKDAAPPSGG